MASRADEVMPTRMDDDKSPEQIEREIEATRANMTDTINSIEAKLSPERIKDQALEGAKEAAEQLKESVIESTRQATQQALDTAQSMTQQRTEEMITGLTDTVSEAGSSLLDLVRRHPVPAALAAVGIGWLIMEERNSSASTGGGYQMQRAYASGREASYGQRGWSSYQTSGRSEGYAGGYGTERTPVLYEGDDESGRLDDAQQQARQLAGQAQDVVRDAKDRVADVASEARQTVDDALSRAVDVRQDLSWEMRQQARQLPSRLEQMVQENPLAVGLVALGIGAAIGLALPETETENRLMGEVSDDLKQRTEQVAQQAQAAIEETVQHAKSAADTVKQTVQQEVEEKQLVEKVKTAVDETAASAKQVAATTKQSATAEAKALADEATQAAQDVKSTAQDAAQDVKSTTQDAMQDSGDSERSSAERSSSEWDI